MAIVVLVRFYEELNDHLPPSKRKQDLAAELTEDATVAHLLSRFAVPVEMVDLILCNGKSVGLSHALRDGDRVSVYPAFEAVDIAGIRALPGRPLRRTRFLAPPGLRPLATLLSARGFDARIEASDPDRLSCVAQMERRILLLEASTSEPARLPDRVCRVAPSDPEDQLREVLARLDLQGTADHDPPI